MSVGRLGPGPGPGQYHPEFDPLAGRADGDGRRFTIAGWA